MNYVGISEYYRPIPELDHWLKRRVRRCYWKQWRKRRTKVRNLLKLGVPLKAAISVGMSRKSFWRLSKTYATQLGICLCVPARRQVTNHWLKEQGVISIKDLWVNRHDPATARSHPRNAFCGRVASHRVAVKRYFCNWPPPNPTSNFHWMRLSSGLEVWNPLTIHPPVDISFSVKQSHFADLSIPPYQLPRLSHFAL